MSQRRSRDLRLINNLEKITREIVLAGLCTSITQVLSQPESHDAHYSALYALLKISLAGKDDHWIGRA